MEMIIRLLYCILIMVFFGSPITGLKLIREVDNLLNVTENIENLMELSNIANDIGNDESENKRITQHNNSINSFHSYNKTTSADMEFPFQNTKNTELMETENTVKERKTRDTNRQQQGILFNILNEENNDEIETKYIYGKTYYSCQPNNIVVDSYWCSANANNPINSLLDKRCLCTLKKVNCNNNDCNPQWCTNCIGEQLPCMAQDIMPRGLKLDKYCEDNCMASPSYCPPWLCKCNAFDYDISQFQRIDIR